MKLATLNKRTRQKHIGSAYLSQKLIVQIVNQTKHVVKIQLVLRKSF